MKKFHNDTVVVPFDFSDASQDAVDKVLEWADETSQIHLIFAVVPAMALIAYDVAVPIPPSLDTETQKNSLDRLKKRFGDEKYKRINIHCNIGDPGSEIVELADSVKANMIVMPSHGRTGLLRLFIGSVAERVLRLANCPVLILRSKSTDSGKFENAKSTSTKSSSGKSTANTA